jgi:hypothetical protein
LLESAQPEAAYRYRAQGACDDIFACTDEAFVTAGPAGTGKTRAVLTKIFLRAEKYPGSRHLICRQTRKSCTESCLVEWEAILPPGHPCIGRRQRDGRTSYVFPNGSVVVVGGLDDPGKLYSSQWDTIYVNEGIEATDDAIEILASRLRNGKCGYHQLIIDTNPGPPTHWLKKWIDDNRITHIPTTHRDNARYYDEDKGDWTEEGHRYIVGVLQKMTGARYDRLYLGKWSTPEGARWPYFDPRVHQFSKEQLWPQGVPEWYAKWVSIDHGFGNPYCALWHCQDGEGNLYTFREDYDVGLTADIQAERVAELSKANEKYSEVILDPSMWHQDPRAQPNKHTREVSAAEIYTKRLGTKDDVGYCQFGPVVPGTRVTREQMFLTLDKYLQRDNGWPDWFIDYSCTNLRDELIGAVLNRNKTTGIWSEDLDPTCPDHALTSAGFGFVTRYPTTKVEPKSPLQDFSHDDYNRKLRELQEEESERDFTRSSTNSIRI